MSSAYPQKSLSAQTVPYSSPFCWFPHLIYIDIDAHDSRMPWLV